MIAAARCLIQPSFKIQSILRAILRDEIINWNKKNTSASSSNTATTPGGSSKAGGDSSGAEAATASTSGGGAAEGGGGSGNESDNKDREVIIEKVTSAVKAILSRLNRYY